MATRRTLTTKPAEPSGVAAARERGVYVPPELDPSYVQALTEGGYGAGPGMLRSAINRSLGLTETGEDVDPRLAAAAGVGSRFTASQVPGLQARAMPTEPITEESPVYTQALERGEGAAVREAARGRRIGAAAGEVTPQEELEAKRAATELEAAWRERVAQYGTIGDIGRTGFPEDVPPELWSKVGITPPEVREPVDYKPGDLVRGQGGREFVFESWKVPGRTAIVHDPNDETSRGEIRIR